MFERIGDILERTQAAHAQLLTVLEDIQQETSDARIETLLQIGRREQVEMQETLKSASNSDLEGIANVHLQYIPDDNGFNIVKTLDYSSSDSLDDVVRLKMQFDEALISLFGQLAEVTNTPRLNEFFKSLRDYVESAVQKQAWRLRDFQGETEPPKA